MAPSRLAFFREFGLLFTDPPGIDPEYNRILEISKKQQNEAVQELERMWTLYKPYADPDFNVKIKEDYWPRIWELNLGIAFLGRKLKLITKNAAKGPDFLIDENGQHIYIEAICPTKGRDKQPDTIEELSSEVYKTIDLDKIEIRIQSAISEKFNKYFKKKDSFPGKENDPYVIAISASRLPNANFNFCGDKYMNLIRAVVPVGKSASNYDIRRNIIFNRHWELKVANTKMSGSQVPKDYFINDKYSRISGILYCACDYPVSTENIGLDTIYLMKNPFAKNKIEGNLGFKKINIEITDSTFSYTRE
jgi:hypothetical protein